MPHRLFAVFALVLFVLPARAEPPARLEELIAALRLDETLEVMAQEGIAYGNELEAEMFPGRGKARWQAMVTDIYDAARARQVMRETLGEALSGTDLDPLVMFFGGETGARIVGLELSARRALLDPDVEDASRETVERMRDAGDTRLGLLEVFVAVNDLVEMNVAGGLNANYAFYAGLVAGGAFPFDMSEEEMLAEVWSQEPELREETEAWLYSYLAMAYQPLSDAELQAYIALSETAEGQALNQALFAGFDVLFRQVSRDLGVGAAQFIQGEDI